MINDRGNMKWISLMLPEHLKLLKEWKKEQYYGKKRDLTEWELEEIEQTIQRAFKLRKLVKLTLWEHNKTHDLVGVVTGADTWNKELLLETDLSIKRISMELIQTASLVVEDD